MTVISKRGGRRPGAGRKKQPGRLLRDAIEGIDVEGIVKNLREWAKGKEVYCPHCLKNTGKYTADTVALQSAIELLNRRLGKVPQSVQLDITETIQLDADQVGSLIEKHKEGFLVMVAERYLQEFVARNRQAIRPMITEGDIIEGEVVDEG